MAARREAMPSWRRWLDLFGLSPRANDLSASFVLAACYTLLSPPFGFSFPSPPQHRWFQARGKTTSSLYSLFMFIILCLIHFCKIHVELPAWRLDTSLIYYFKFELANQPTLCTTITLTYMQTIGYYCAFFGTGSNLHLYLIKLMPTSNLFRYHHQKTPTNKSYYLILICSFIFLFWT